MAPHKNKKRFRKIYIEITRRCNLSCTFCPEKNHANSDLSLQNFQRILNQITPYTDLILLHILGEPLLHPDLKKILDLTHESNLKINLTTNGTLIHQKQGVLLGHPAIRQVNVSLHSFIATGADDINRARQYLGPIIKFARNQPRGVATSFRIWNQGEVPPEEMAGSKILEKLLKEEFLEVGLNDPGRGLELEAGIYLNRDRRFTWPSLHDPIVGASGFCYGLRDHLGILVDGTVVPCCLDHSGSINLGNILDDSLEEILNNPRTQNIVHGFSNRQCVEDLCRRCSFIERFKRESRKI